jgi:hypothetical protein
LNIGETYIALASFAPEPEPLIAITAFEVPSDHTVVDVAFYKDQKLVVVTKIEAGQSYLCVPKVFYYNGFRILETLVFNIIDYEALNSVPMQSTEALFDLEKLLFEQGVVLQPLSP